MYDAQNMYAYKGELKGGMFFCLAYTTRKQRLPSQAFFYRAK